MPLGLGSSLAIRSFITSPMGRVGRRHVEARGELLSESFDERDEQVA